MDKHSSVAVIGAGKMGLPLACRLASNGANVTCIDANPTVVDLINRGEAHFEEPGLSEVLASVVENGLLRATTNTAAGVAAADVVIVIVPVILTEDRKAETSIIDSVAAAIGASMRAGTMVVFETTLPVGHTRKLANTLSQGGLRPGVDFDLVFSPERVKSQSVLENLSKNAKIVGGINEQSASRAAEFYAKYLQAPIINVHTLEAAEFAKLAGMVYRDVNIALANELAAYADACGIDFGAVRAASNTDGEAAILMPGIGVGGHCTPVYPYFFINDAEKRGVDTTLASVSRMINDGQAARAVELAAKAAGGSLAGQAVLILGLGFRPQVKESLYSPAFLLQSELLRAGARVYIRDPLYTNDELSAHGFTPYDWASEKLPPVVVLNTAHDVFKSITPQELKDRGVKVLVDGRNLWSPHAVRELGLQYIAWGNTQEHQPGSETSSPSGSSMPIAKPVLGEPEISGAARVIRSGWLMQGKEVDALEHEFAQFTGAKYSCAVSSGTAALHLSLIAAGIRPGDEVITVSHSFIATANAIRYCGAVPVFADVSAATFNVQPELVEKCIGPRTRAILCVHQMGMPADIAALNDIAQRHGLLLLEDACCALGSTFTAANVTEPVGKPHGISASFSFHPRKLLTTGDGGMITTNDEEQYKLFRSLRNHGMVDGQHVQLGYNYRLTDVQAAIGREQLRRLPAMIARRRQRARLYSSLLADVPGLVVPAEPMGVETNWQSYCILLASKAERDAIAKLLENKGISTRPGITCIHREPAYVTESWSCRAGGACDCGPTCQRLRVSERCQDTGLILPLFDRISDADQVKVAETIKQQLRSRC